MRLLQLDGSLTLRVAGPKVKMVFEVTGTAALFSI
jgi:hypothetical protein